MKLRKRKSPRCCKTPAEISTSRQWARKIPPSPGPATAAIHGHDAFSGLHRNDWRNRNRKHSFHQSLRRHPSHRCPLSTQVPSIASLRTVRRKSFGITRDPDVIYSLSAFLPGGKLLLGTGNQGAVLELDGNHIYSRLAKTSSHQVTSMAVGPGGKLFLAAANPGKIFTLGPGDEQEGTFVSQPFDAHIFSRWGRTEWWGRNVAPGKNAAGARIEFYARSGNTSDPENSWSAWAGPYSNVSGDKLDCPAARFVQWKAVLHGGGTGPAPEIDWVSVAYLPKNVAPEITATAVQNPGRPRSGGWPCEGLNGGVQTPVQLRMPQPAPTASSPELPVRRRIHYESRNTGQPGAF